jgi:putative FmdB family regulatory protein
MPTYDYECLECKDKFEVFQSMTEDPVKICSKCGGKVRKLISAGAGIIFKGSGFYVNDYKKNSGSADTGKKSAPAADNSNASGKNADSSSAPATTATPVTPAAEPKKSSTESTASTSSS